MSPAYIPESPAPNPSENLDFRDPAKPEITAQQDYTGSMAKKLHEAVIGSSGYLADKPDLAHAAVIAGGDHIGNAQAISWLHATNAFVQHAANTYGDALSWHLRNEHMRLLRSQETRAQAASIGAADTQTFGKAFTQDEMQGGNYVNPNSALGKIDPNSAFWNEGKDFRPNGVSILKPPVDTGALSEPAQGQFAEAASGGPRSEPANYAPESPVRQEAQAMANDSEVNIVKWPIGFYKGVNNLTNAAWSWISDPVHDPNTVQGAFYDHPKAREALINALNSYMAKNHTQEQIIQLMYGKGPRSYVLWQEAGAPSYGEWYMDQNAGTHLDRFLGSMGEGIKQAISNIGDASKNLTHLVPQEIASQKFGFVTNDNASSIGNQIFGNVGTIATVGSGGQGVAQTLNPLQILQSIQDQFKYWVAAGQKNGVAGLTQAMLPTVIGYLIGGAAETALSVTTESAIKSELIQGGMSATDAALVAKGLTSTGESLAKASVVLSKQTGMPVADAEKSVLEAEGLQTSEGAPPAETEPTASTEQQPLNAPPRTQQVTGKIKLTDFGTPTLPSERAVTGTTIQDAGATAEDGAVSISSETATKVSQAVNSALEYVWSTIDKRVLNGTLAGDISHFTLETMANNVYSAAMDTLQNSAQAIDQGELDAAFRAGADTISKQMNTWFEEYSNNQVAGRWVQAGGRHAVKVGSALVKSVGKGMEFLNSHDVKKYWAAADVGNILGMTVDPQLDPELWNYSQKHGVTIGQFLTGGNGWQSGVVDSIVAMFEPPVGIGEMFKTGDAAATGIDGLDKAFRTDKRFQRALDSLKGKSAETALTLFPQLATKGSEGYFLALLLTVPDLDVTLKAAVDAAAKALEDGASASEAKAAHHAVVAAAADVFGPRAETYARMRNLLEAGQFANGFNLPRLGIYGAIRNEIKLSDQWAMTRLSRVFSKAGWAITQDGKISAKIFDYSDPAAVNVLIANARQAGLPNTFIDEVVRTILENPNDARVVQRAAYTVVREVMGVEMEVAFNHALGSESQIHFEELLKALKTDREELKKIAKGKAEATPEQEAALKQWIAEKEAILGPHERLIRNVYKAIDESAKNLVGDFGAKSDSPFAYRRDPAGYPHGGPADISAVQVRENGEPINQALTSKQIGKLSIPSSQDIRRTFNDLLKNELKNVDKSFYRAADVALARNSFRTVDAINWFINDQLFKPLALLTGGWAIRVSVSELGLNTARLGPSTVLSGFVAENMIRSERKAMRAIQRRLGPDGLAGLGTDINPDRPLSDLVAEGFDTKTKPDETMAAQPSPTAKPRKVAKETATKAPAKKTTGRAVNVYSERQGADLRVELGNAAKKYGATDSEGFKMAFNSIKEFVGHREDNARLYIARNEEGDVVGAAWTHWGNQKGGPITLDGIGTLQSNGSGKAMLNQIFKDALAENRPITGKSLEGATGFWKKYGMLGENQRISASVEDIQNLVAQQESGSLLEGTKLQKNLKRRAAEETPKTPIEEKATKVLSEGVSPYQEMGFKSRNEARVKLRSVRDEYRAWAQNRLQEIENDILASYEFTTLRDPGPRVSYRMPGGKIGYRWRDAGGGNYDFLEMLDEAEIKSLREDGILSASGVFPDQLHFSYVMNRGEISPDEVMNKWLQDTREKRVLLTIARGRMPRANEWKRLGFLQDAIDSNFADANAKFGYKASQIFSTEESAIQHLSEVMQANADPNVAYARDAVDDLHKRLPLSAKPSWQMTADEWVMRIYKLEDELARVRELEQQALHTVDGHYEINYTPEEELASDELRALLPSDIIPEATFAYIETNNDGMYEIYGALHDLARMAGENVIPYNNETLTNELNPSTLYQKFTNRNVTEKNIDNWIRDNQHKNALPIEYFPTGPRRLEPGEFLTEEEKKQVGKVLEEFTPDEQQFISSDLTKAEKEKVDEEVGAYRNLLKPFYYQFARQGPTAAVGIENLTRINEFLKAIDPNEELFKDVTVSFQQLKGPESKLYQEGKLGSWQAKNRPYINFSVERSGQFRKLTSKQITAENYLIKIFFDAINGVGEIGAQGIDRTFVHELWHHLENYVGIEDRNSLQTELEAAREKFLERHPEYDFIKTTNGHKVWTYSGADMKSPLPQFLSPTMETGWKGLPSAQETYRLRNRAEYFAETMYDYSSRMLDRIPNGNKLVAFGQKIMDLLFATLQKIQGRGSYKIFKDFLAQRYALADFTSPFDLTNVATYAGMNDDAAKLISPEGVEATLAEQGIRAPKPVSFQLSMYLRGLILGTERSLLGILGRPEYIKYAIELMYLNEAHLPNEYLPEAISAVHTHVDPSVEFTTVENTARRKSTAPGDFRSFKTNVFSGGRKGEIKPSKWRAYSDNFTLAPYSDSRYWSGWFHMLNQNNDEVGKMLAKMMLDGYDQGLRGEALRQSSFRQLNYYMHRMDKSELDNLLRSKSTAIAGHQSEDPIESLAMDRVDSLLYLVQGSINKSMVDREGNPAEQIVAGLSGKTDKKNGVFPHNNVAGYDHEATTFHYNIVKAMAENNMPASLQQFMERFGRNPIDGQWWKAGEVPQQTVTRDVQGLRGMGNPITRVASLGHEKVLGPIVNALSRKPIFIIEYAAARDELQLMVDQGILSPSEVQVMAKLAAAKKVMKFIHNPLDKMKIEQMTSVLFPFYFAQNQAFRRMGRLFAEDPGAFVRYMRAMMGVVQFVQKVSRTGLGTVAIPLTAYLLGGVPLMFGLSALETMDPLSTQQDANGNQSALQNFTNMFFPKPGLIVEALGHLVLIDNILHLPRDTVFARQTIANQTIGPIASSENLLYALMPNSVIKSGVEALSGGLLDPSHSGNVGDASFMNTSLTILMNQMYHDLNGKISNLSNKKGLSSNEYMTELVNYMTNRWSPVTNPQAINNAIGRAWNQTSITMAVKTILSIASPFSISVGESAKEQFYKTTMGQYIKKYGYAQGMDLFFAVYPDSTILTMSRTKSDLGQYVPENKPEYDFITHNGYITTQYPLIANSFGPDVTKDPNYYSPTVSALLEAGMRQRETPSQFLNQFMVDLGWSYYFDVIKQYHGPIKKKMEQDYELINPLWGDAMKNPVKNERRAVIGQEIQNLANDKSMMDNHNQRTALIAQSLVTWYKTMWPMAQARIDEVSKFKMTSDVYRNWYENYFIPESIATFPLLAIAGKTTIANME